MIEAYPCAKTAAIVAAAFDVPLQAVVNGRIRTRPLLRARQAAMYLARTVRGLSYLQVGRAFHKDHTTVMNAVKRVPLVMAADPIFAATVELCRQECEADMRKQQQRRRERQISDASRLPLRITTTQVLDLACYSEPTLLKRIREGTMPPPVDRARERLFDRDAVLRALGLLGEEKIAAAPPEQVATW